MRTAAVVASLALVAIACSRTKPAGTPTPAPGAAAPTVAAAGAPGAPPRRRVPPNPLQQDTVRRATVDSIMATIAGRENEPAGRVFRNVTVLKDMTAGEFLRTMDTQYGRGLGWTCANCHVVGKFDDDSKKNKRIARQMQVMQDYVNGTSLASVKELDAEYDKATCVMCHRGSSEPKGTMPVPPLPPAPSTPPGT
ncbi:MAG: photosynthetic reaction center cytochrome c subunit [Gemmatimonadaceae bacterium]|nr:photosynthetic reaction center cytochrome c subunit [Gemmatimonadaceae bacterium]